MPRLPGVHALTSQLIGRAVLAACVRTLQPLDIAVMPLKGIWLQEFVYRAGPERVISDVDVLVPDGAFHAARRALQAAGWQQRSATHAEACYAHPEFPLALDLHARLYTRAAFGATTTGLFARGTADHETYGVPVLLPDPLDVLAHLVGHALKSGNAWSDDCRELTDVARIAAVYGLSPDACAARLEAQGLARAARFFLPLMAAESQAFARAVVAALPRDLVGERLARAALRVRAHMPAEQRLSTLVSFALDRSLAHGAYALGLRVIDRAREAPITAAVLRCM